MRAVSRIFRRLINRLPFEIRRRNAASPVLPEATFDNIQMALAYYLRTEAVPTFVQIGASDGVSGDSVHAFVKRGRMHSVLVEPIGSSFQKLKDAYAGVDNVVLVQAAIGTSDGSAELYKVKEDGKALDPYWSRQLASFSKHHLLRHGVPEEEIEVVEVPSLTLSSLMANHGLERIDILQVDTEGFDAEIVKMALQLPFPPECINFENAHLDSATRQSLYPLLEKKGFKWTHDRWNSLALHEGLIERWSGLPEPESAWSEGTTYVG